MQLGLRAGARAMTGRSYQLRGEEVPTEYQGLRNLARCCELVAQFRTLAYDAGRNKRALHPRHQRPQRGPSVLGTDGSETLSGTSGDEIRGLGRYLNSDRHAPGPGVDYLRRRA